MTISKILMIWNLHEGALKDSDLTDRRVKRKRILYDIQFVCIRSHRKVKKGSFHNVWKKERSTKKKVDKSEAKIESELTAFLFDNKFWDKSKSSFEIAAKKIHGLTKKIYDRKYIRIFPASIWSRFAWNEKNFTGEIHTGFDDFSRFFSPIKIVGCTHNFRNNLQLSYPIGILQYMRVCVEKIWKLDFFKFKIGF